MDLNGITSGLAQELGYSESDLTKALSERTDKYQKLLEQAEQTVAATELGKTVKLNETINLPAVGCSLGNIDIGTALRSLAKSDPESYDSAVKNLTSGDVSKFMSALKKITSQTETTLKTELNKLNQGSASRFVNSLSQLAVPSSEADMSEEEAEAASTSRLDNLTAVVASVTGLDEAAIARTIRGIQIYV